MAILLTDKTRVIVQGITGRKAPSTPAQMLEYNTKVVGGVTPGKGGQTWEGQTAHLQHGARRGQSNRRQCVSHLCPAAIRRRCDS